MQSDPVKVFTGNEVVSAFVRSRIASYILELQYQYLSNANDATHSH